MRCLLNGLLLGMLLIGASVGVFSPGALSQEVDDESGNAAGVRLEAIGGLSAVNAEHTYLLINATADGLARGVSDKKRVHSTMDRVIRQLDTCSGLLRKVQKGGLADEDDEYVERVVSLHGRLQAQARALIDFATTRAEQESRAFEKARQSSLRELERLR